MVEESGYSSATPKDKAALIEALESTESFEEGIAKTIDYFRGAC